MTKLKQLTLVILILLISCKKGEKKENITNQIKTENQFQVNLENKPKLFSKFWDGMTQNEFNKTVEILKTEKKVKEKNDSLFYWVGSQKMLLIGSFENDLLKKIVLKGEFTNDIGTSSYDLYREKYSLPKLIKKTKYFEKSTSINYEYKPINQIYIKTNSELITENVPNSLIDFQSEPSKYKYFKRRNWNYVIYETRPEMFSEIPEQYLENDIRFGLHEKEIIIEKDNNTGMSSFVGTLLSE